ncbi:MAG: InlB B-repeat-containing protein [Clostridia bacterium]|nr:InlB B-repeat-containing protein [Clostridia bacterium]
MRKILMLVLSVVMAAGFMAGCRILDDYTASNSDSSTTSQGSSVTPSEKTFTVTFKQDGCADVVKEVKEGETLTDVPRPAEKIGYTVTWDQTDFTNIKDNIKVTAIEKANKYTVTYDAKGGSVTPETQEVVFDEKTTLATPQKQDYVFLGWTYKGAAVVDGAKWSIADNVKLEATWQDARPTYKVTFVDGSQSKVVDVKKGESVADADVPPFVGKTGYTVAWSETDYTNIQADMRVEANYKPITYIVTYNADGYEIDGKTVELTYDALCAGLDMSLTSVDKNFLGWTYVGVTYTRESTWKVADVNVVLEAAWAPKDQIVITFTDTDGSLITKTVYEGADLTDIPKPKDKPGYAVDKDNWYVDEACTTIATFTNIQEKVTVYAKATANKYTISYNANGGSVANPTQEVYYDETYTLETPTHEKSYMRFDGWKEDVNGNLITSGTWKTDGNISLTAQWTDTRAVYTISFVQAGKEKKTFTVKQGESFTNIPDPVAKTGYTVTWEEKDLTNVQGNIEVKAIEIPDTYMITLKLYDGKAENAYVTYGNSYEFKTPTRTGYTFQGWKYNGEDFAAKGTWNIVVTNECVIEAQWEKIPVTDDSEEWTGNY